MSEFEKLLKELVDALDGNNEAAAKVAGLALASCAFAEISRLGDAADRIAFALEKIANKETH